MCIPSNYLTMLLRSALKVALLPPWAWASSEVIRGGNFCFPIPLPSKLCESGSENLIRHSDIPGI